MDAKIVWTEQAVEDLREIIEFIALDKQNAAVRFGAALIAKAESLSLFPRKGRVVPELRNPVIREIIHGSYRIVYEFEETTQTVAISRVWHAARGIPEITGDKQ